MVWSQRATSRVVLSGLQKYGSAHSQYRSLSQKYRMPFPVQTIAAVFLEWHSDRKPAGQKQSQRKAVLDVRYILLVERRQVMECRPRRFSLWHNFQGER